MAGKKISFHVCFSSWRLTGAIGQPPFSCVRGLHGPFRHGAFGSRPPVRYVQRAAHNAVAVGRVAVALLAVLAFRAVDRRFLRLPALHGLEADRVRRGISLRPRAAAARPRARPAQRRPRLRRDKSLVIHARFTLPSSPRRSCRAPRRPSIPPPSQHPRASVHSPAPRRRPRSGL